MAIFGGEQYKKKPLVLISMDGVGVAPPGPGNAVTLSKTPNLDYYWPRHAHGVLQASGLYVGLPANTDGNSEVGHMTMGAGKVILQDKPRIDNAIQNNTFESNPVLLEAFDSAVRTGGAVHFMGLVGRGHVHSSFEHLEALIKMASNYQIDPNKVYIHAFTDGRDTTPKAGLELLERVEAITIQNKCGRIVSVIGRAYAMDRNRNWKRTKLAYDLLTKLEGPRVTDWRKHMRDSYEKKVTDEYMDPFVIVDKGDPRTTEVKDGDSVIFFNFRQDRARQLTMMFEQDEFAHIERDSKLDVYFSGMTDYGNGFPKKVAFPEEEVTNPLGKVLAKHGKRQLRIAESEKFPHVTYFFNGGNGNVSDTETWVEVPSPKDVVSYDQKPEMSMEWVTDILIENLEKDEYDFVVVNLAGPDMVAHTGRIEPTIKAMEVCDAQVGRIVKEVLRRDGIVVITADHGNAEELVNLRTGEGDTKHSTNEVPIMIVGNEIGPVEIAVGGLSDIAPTILGLMNLPVPPNMTGRKLIE